MDNYDVVIIGGGVAGLSAALTLGRSKRSVLVVDAGEPRNAPAAGVHGYLTRDGMPPGALLEAGRADLAPYDVQVVSGTVTGLELGFEVAYRHQTGDRTADEAGSRTVHADRVVLATGLVDELPEIPGLAQRWGKDVIHCPYCHGWEVRDQPIGLLAMSPLSSHQAFLYSQLTDDLVVFLHDQPALPSEPAALLAALGVRVVEGRVVAFEAGGVRLESGELFPRAALAIGPRVRARTDLLAGLGVEPVELRMNGHLVGTHVPTDESGQTPVPGLYAAGNAADLRAAVPASVAAGQWVGSMVNLDLVMAKARALLQPA